MYPSIVTNELLTSEIIIHSTTNAQFSIFDKSTFGTHTLFITNHGRVIGHDTGGIFGSERTNVYDGSVSKLRVVFENTGIRLTEFDSSGMTFSVSFTLEEFLDIYNKMGGFFSFKANDSIDGYVCYDRKPYTAVKIEMAQEGVLIKNSELGLLPYTRIKSLQYDEKTGILTLQGVFELNKKILRELQFFVVDQHVIQTVYQFHNSHQNLFRLVGENFDALSSISVEGIFNGSRLDQKLTLVADGKLYLINEKQNQILGELSREIYWDHEINRGIYCNQGDVCVLSELGVDIHPQFQKRIPKDSSLFFSAGKYPGKNLSVSVIHDNQHLLVIDHETWKVIDEIYLPETDLFLDEKEKVCFVLQGRLIKKLLIEHNRLFAFLQGRKKGLAYSKSGHLYGCQEGKSYTHAAVDVLLKLGEISFIHSQSQDIISSFHVNQGDLCEALGRILIHENGEVALLTNLRKELLDWIRLNIPLSDISAYNIGFTDKNMPFLLHHNEQGLAFSFSKDSSFLEIPNLDVKDILIEDRDEDISKVKIIRKSGQGLVIYIFSERVKNLIQNTFNYTKMAALPMIPAEDMYVSWSRHINDYVVYHYFGELFAVYEGLQRGLQESNSIKRNMKLVNYLYHGIQAVKKRIDMVSIYLPATLEKEEQVFLNQMRSDGMLGDPFKPLQRNLMGIAAQMNRSLGEIERCLLQVSFAIDDTLNIRPKLKKARKENEAENLLKNTGLMIAGAVAAPVLGPLLFIGGIGLFNGIFSSKQADKLEEIQQNHQNNLLEFNLLKAVDSYHHLMQTLMPYYISEVNNVVYQSLSNLRKSYHDILEVPDTKKHLFDKISDLYTFKQLPIDDSVLLAKKELVEVIQDTVMLSENIMNDLSLKEGNLDVQKSIPGTLKLERV